ncbi:uncharacterized protein LOC115222996 [Argonauta hians]
MSMLLLWIFNLEMEESLEEEEVASNGYLVRSPACNIPNADPYDVSIKKYIHKTHWKPCPGGPSLTFQDDNMLRFNKSVLNRKYKNLHICKIYPIVRVHTDDRHIKYLPEALQFKSDVNMSHEFIKVECYDKNKTIYTNFHAFVQKKEFLFKDKAPNGRQHNANTTSKNSKSNKFSMNVVLIGIDSVSRLNFIRQMPLTRNFLLDHGALEMFGYNKVGDNTFPNMVPLLTGHYVEELPGSSKLNKEPFDKYDIMFKHYNNSGYVTMFTEDAPHIGLFRYLKFGFKKQPVDHYFMPFALGIAKEKSFWSNRNYCFGNRMEAEIDLQYTYDFMRVYKNDPHFAFTFISRVSHDDMNEAGKTDFEYLRFLQKSFKNNLLNNTILFMFGDHGIRFGGFRTTYIGRLEERLPAMYILPPPWFRSKYPTLWNNLKLNTHRLTTHFDIYDTLEDILDIQKAAERSKSDRIDYKNLKRISLLRKVPLNRSCEAASLKRNWCTCHDIIAVNVTDKIVTEAAKYLVNKLNNLTSNFSKECVRLHLQQIKSAGVTLMNEKVLSYVGNGTQTHKDYQITITTLPGKGQFEGSVRYFSVNKQFMLLGRISRVNRYGLQSDCINDYRLKLYCYCKH